MLVISTQITLKSSKIMYEIGRWLVLNIYQNLWINDSELTLFTHISEKNNLPSIAKQRPFNNLSLFGTAFPISSSTSTKMCVLIIMDTIAAQSVNQSKCPEAFFVLCYSISCNILYVGYICSKTLINIKFEFEIQWFEEFM